MANSVDIIKFFCCILIVASHVGDIIPNTTANYFYGQWFFRFCVPFFFMSSGYFFTGMNSVKKRSYILRILAFYIISSVLYSAYIAETSPLWYQIAFGFHHLWYLIALAEGLILLWLTEFISKRAGNIFAVVMLAVGIIFCTYWKMSESEAVKSCANFIDSYMGGARNGIFFAFPMLAAGRELYRHKEIFNMRLSSAVMFTIAAFVLSFIEAECIRRNLTPPIYNDVTIFGWTPAFFLLIIGLKVHVKYSPETMRTLRKVNDLVYILHAMLVIIADKQLELPRVSNFLFSAVVSFGVSFAIVSIAKRIGKR